MGDLISEPIAAVATHAFSCEVKRGKRRSKYDQRVTVARGDVILLHAPKPGSAPFVVKVNGGVEGLSFHPGNFIMSQEHYRNYGKRAGNQVVYQDRWFVIFTNISIMQKSLLGMLKAGGDGTMHVPLMERIVIAWTYKNPESITDEVEKIWAKYYKLRELWHRPGFKGEGDAAKRMAVKILVGLILNHIAPKSEGNGAGPDSEF